MLHDSALFRTVLLLAAVIFIIAATQRWRVHPFVAIIAAASAFGFAAEIRMPFIGQMFGVGFAAMIYTPGLVIVAAGFIGGLAERTGASTRLMALVDGRRRMRPNWVAAVLGLIAGLGASPTAAFALLSPLLRPLGGKSPATRETATVALALALSASHGLAPLSPVAIAAVTIIGADWHRTVLLGSPLLLLLTGFAAIFARRLPASEAATDAPDWQPSLRQRPASRNHEGIAAVALILALLVPLLMLTMRSLADIPSEPLGGEPGLETLVAAGQPLFLLLIGIGIMMAGAPRQSFALLGDAAWAGRILTDVSIVVLIVCAAGGFQALCQQAGMAEVIGERLVGWLAGTSVGLLVPFVIAAAMKVLQGSSLIAAITTAGMVQPLLTPLGLAGDNGRALAALAIGIGAMTVCHLNDEYFWLTTASAGTRPLRGVATISLGTLWQGLIALAVLVVASLLLPHS